MTYYNFSAYDAEIPAGGKRFAHDDCLPADQFTTDRHGCRQQVMPWRWDRIYGVARECAYCGGLTEAQNERGNWQPLHPLTWVTTRDGRQLAEGQQVTILTPINYHDGYGEIVSLLPGGAGDVPCVMVRDRDGRRAVVNAVNVSIDAA